MNNIGTVCKAYRKKIGYSQENVASDLGMTQSTISLFEAGKYMSGYVMCWYVANGLANDGDFYSQFIDSFWSFVRCKKRVHENDSK